MGDPAGVEGSMVVSLSTHEDSPSSPIVPTNSVSTSDPAPATPPLLDSQNSSSSMVSSSSFSSENGKPNNSNSTNTDISSTHVIESSPATNTNSESPTLSTSSANSDSNSNFKSNSNTVPISPVKSSIPPPTLSDLRCLSDFYSVLHFLDLFNITSTLNIQNFTIDKLENALLDCGPFLIDIIIKLLKCISRKPINYDTWEKTLQLLIKNRIGEYTGDENPLDDTSFYDLSLKERVRILLSICDWQLDDNPNLQSILDDNKMVPKLRGLTPVGKDKEDNLYYYFDMGGTMRLCRQGYDTPPPIVTKTKGKKDKAKETIYANPDTTTWETVAATLSEFEDFAFTLRKSKNKNETLLLKLIENTYIPALQAKEKSQQMAQKRMQRLDVDTTNIMSSGRARKSIKYSSFFEDHNDDE